MKIDIGATVQLQLIGDNDAPRGEVTLIGYLAGKSLVVTTPQSEEKPFTLKAGDHVAVRYMGASDIYAFSTVVMGLNNTPYDYLHLRYPEKIEAVKIRKAQRAETNIEVRVAKGGVAVGEDGVRLLDLSASGCMLVAQTHLGEKEDILSLTMPLTFSGMREKLRIAGVIRNSKIFENQEGKRRVQYGLEFGKLDQHQSLFINGYVFEQLANGRGG
ncbi:hypothetical protein BOW53_11490 [Solemya pervernicosa gill symbiont]|uniref:Flagellar brake protein n=2 Tax=Gammaproteobacteria incertae sedis TaxID=118884 RepID=A0A1T2L340_9GAMM|nr:flagellar brake protein [Candidatus Reidiella endopervernicosa]OOZ39430.1 hypothetical protein BOW53_11490 [Solemya pervernicosa gill symbiont]QKQ26725.1 flagellar brake protein [Candidatus Reidiella endopervernicosa]